MSAHDIHRPVANSDKKMADMQSMHMGMMMHMMKNSLCRV